MSRRQLHLFGDPPVPPGRGPVGPAAVPDALREVARRLPPEVRLGTSSWSFPGWQGLVYDRAASASRLAQHGLAAYARHPLLRAVGVDRTFYAPVAAAALAEYASVVPPEFRFVVKADSRCTTPFLRGPSGRPAGENPSYLDPSYATGEVVAPFVEGLGPRGAALVFQFPPQGRPRTDDPSRFAATLATFLGGLPSGPTYAVELRDRELFGNAYVEALRSTGASHCISVHPRMPGAVEQHDSAEAALGDRLVVRWMLGAGSTYEQAKERYAPFSALVDQDPASRRSLAGICRARAARGCETIVIVNNKAEGSAPLSAFRLAEEISLADDAAAARSGRPAPG